MAKMRKFHFWNEAGDEKDTEQLSLTRAVKAVQSDFKDMFIGVEYINKKGKEIGRFVEYPRESVEEDILKIVSGEAYKHSYEN